MFPPPVSLLLDTERCVSVSATVSDVAMYIVFFLYFVFSAENTFQSGIPESKGF